MLSFYLTILTDENKALFENIYNTYRKQMVAVALSITDNLSDAEDAVHTVFLRIATKYMDTVEKMDFDNDLKYYLLTSTKYSALTITSKKRIGDVSLDDESIKNTVLDKSNEDFIDIIYNKTTGERILKAIDSLDEKYRTVLYYHFVLELKMSHVAEIMGQSINTTKKQLVRGKKKLLLLLDNLEDNYE